MGRCLCYGGEGELCGFDLGALEGGGAVGFVAGTGDKLGPTWYTWSARDGVQKESTYYV